MRANIRTHAVSKLFQSEETEPTKNTAVPCECLCQSTRLDKSDRRTNIQNTFIISTACERQIYIYSLLFVRSHMYGNVSMVIVIKCILRLRCAEHVSNRISVCICSRKHFASVFRNRNRFSIQTKPKQIHQRANAKSEEIVRVCVSMNMLCTAESFPNHGIAISSNVNESYSRVVLCWQLGFVAFANSGLKFTHTHVQTTTL